jgi:hypothetical protein
MYVKYKIPVFAGIVCFLTVKFALTDHPGYLDNMKKEKQLTLARTWRFLYHRRSCAGA